MTCPLHVVGAARQHCLTLPFLEPSLLHVLTTIASSSFLPQPSSYIAAIR